MTTPVRYPATFAQRSMFLQNAAHPNDNSFDLAFAYRLDGPVNIERLYAVVGAVIDAAPGMSTRFEHTPEGLNAVFDGVTATSEIVDISIDVSPDADQQDAWVTGRTEALVAAGPIRPTDRVQARAILYRGASAVYFTLICSHIVGDAYSFYRFVGAVGQLYSSAKSTWAQTLEGLGDHPGTVPAPAVTERGQIAYRETLSVVESFEHPAFAVQRVEGKIHGIEQTVRIDGAEATRIRESAVVREFGAATVFFAAYASTLQKLSGEGTVVMGVPVAGRAGYTAKKAIGFFANTLPLPVQMQPGLSWWTLCEDVKHGLRLLQMNQGVDLAGADASLTPDYVSFRGVDNAVTLYTQGLVLAIEAATVTALPLRRTTLSYPFSATIADDQSGYDIVIKSADNLTPAAPDRLLLEALDELVGDPSRCVVRESVLTDESPVTDPALVKSTSGDDNETVLDLIERAANVGPTAIALRIGANSVTYGELVASYQRLAHTISSTGATSHVVVTMPKGREAIIAMLAVMASGRVYVPVDPNSPEDRTKLILNRLTTTSGIAPTILDQTAFQRLESDSDTASTASAASRPRASDAAYVIFTSGSTGEPKGVVIPHRNIVHLMESTIHDFELDRSDTWCAFHSFAFDFSIWEIFGPLATGGTLAIPTIEEVRNPAAFLRFLETARVTVLNQTPSAFRRLSESVAGGSSTLPDIRLVIFGGEALYPADLRGWTAEARSGIRYINMYGITETTVHVTAYEVTAHDIEFETRSLIGRPLKHLEAIVVDQFGRECPSGIPGELLVLGKSLAAGYLGRPDLTTKRFRPILHGGSAQTAYVTGDKVYRTDDGQLIYVGRLDDQIQLRGYRIELGEIEAALTSSDDVSAVVVRLVQKDGTEPYLVAWTALIGDVSVGRSATAGAEGQRARRTRTAVRGLRRHLASRLPSYMHPSVIVPLERIPTNLNGKPDLAQLLEAEDRYRENERLRTASLSEESPTTRSSGVESDEPVRRLAHRIARIWEDIIGTGRISIDDRFMEVGGTSMHVMQVHSRLRSELHIENLDLIDLFEHATAEDLAAHLISKNPTTAGAHDYPDMAAVTATTSSSAAQREGELA